MQRIECLRLLAPMVDDNDLVAASLANTTKEWHAVRPKDSNLYEMNMGLSLPVSLGLALALPHRRVISLESDGSMLLMMGNLATLGNVRPSNLTVIVFDNEAYAVTGGLPSATAGGVDLAGVAASCGVPHVAKVTDLAAFAREARAALQSSQCTVIVAKVEKIGYKSTTDMDGPENKYHFVRHVERMEGIRIIHTTRWEDPKDKKVNLRIG